MRGTVETTQIQYLWVHQKPWKVNPSLHIRKWMLKSAKWYPPMSTVGGPVRILTTAAVSIIWACASVSCQLPCDMPISQRDPSLVHIDRAILGRVPLPFLHPEMKWITIPQWHWWTYELHNTVIGIMGVFVKHTASRTPPEKHWHRISKGGPGDAGSPSISRGSSCTRMRGSHCCMSAWACGTVQR